MLINLGLMGFGMMGPRYGAHIATALALLALGMGFIVFYKACKMDCCKKFGKLIGVIIMIVSFLLLVCLAIMCFNCTVGKQCHKRSYKGMGGKFTHPPIEMPEHPEKK